MIDARPDTSRRALSREICERLDWRTRQGKPKQMSCRVALLKLEREGKIRLPAAKAFGSRRHAAKKTIVEAEPVCCGLEKLQPITLVLIGSGDREHSKTWNNLMEQYHPLGSGPLCGAQLRYLIRAADGEWLGGLAFSAAAWRLKARDEWIGWDGAAREQNLERVAANSRFLILPHVRVAHLASHVLGMAVVRLRQDWKQRYGYELSLLETFVDTKYSGTSYRAANWIEIGHTQGR